MSGGAILKGDRTGDRISFLRTVTQYGSLSGINMGPLAIGALVGLTVLALCEWTSADAMSCDCNWDGCIMMNPTTDALKNAESTCATEKHNINNLMIVRFYHENLTTNTFGSFPYLTDLEINDGMLSNIEPGAFEKTPYLKAFIIRNNMINTLQNDTFRGLYALETLFIISSELTTISPNAFNGLKNLTHLDLMGNKLTQLPENLFASSPALTSIILEKNLISNVLPASIFNNMNDIFMLSLSHNRLTAFEFPSLKAAQVLLHNNSLTSLYLNDHFTLVQAEHNRIKKLSGTGAKLHTLHLAKNYLADASPISRMINLDTLTLNNNPLRPNSVFNSLRRLVQLNLRHTNIKLTNETFANMVELKLLDLSYNNLKELDLSMFSGLVELQTLIVAFNHIDKINFLELREYLPNLRVLEFCGNGWNATYLSHELKYVKMYKLKAGKYVCKPPFASGEQASDETYYDDYDEYDSSMEGLPSIPLEQQFAEFYPSSTTTTTAKPTPSSTVSTTTPKTTTSKMTTTSTTGLPKPSTEPSVRPDTDTMVPAVAPSSTANEQPAEADSSPLCVTFQVILYTFPVLGVVAICVVAYYMHQRRLDILLMELILFVLPRK
ncbi:protein slit-like [Anopheles ziemanni]|uniref:protein slit-like n=1 Tax=Anopheles coustani TaxID=139045 RepID=UPI00265A2698|nr:protein slit-like [Anopheles coustani]XP_058170152.1 protein slit-like [Anopheles ziemanni]